MFNFSWFAGLVDGLKPHPLPLCSQKNEMLLFWITLNFWWLARLSDGLKPHPPSLSSQKMKCSFLYYFELLMISQAGQWTQTPSASPLQPIKWNAHFWIMFNFWWSAGLVEELKPHPSPLSTQKHEMLIFGSCSTSDDWPGWSMDCNPICHPSPAKNMKCYFLDYAQLLMIGWAHQWIQTPSSTPLQPKKWNAHFWIMFNFWWLAGLVSGLKPHPPPLSSQRNEMLIFVLCSTSNDRLGWSMDSKPIHHPSSAKKVKCSFLFYIQHLMLARLVNGLEPHPPSLSSQKMKCSFLYYFELLMISQAGQWTWTSSTTRLQPTKWNAHILNAFNFWWSARLVDGLKPYLPPLSYQKNEMLIFGLCSTSDDQPGW